MCDHERRDFYLELRLKDGQWSEWPKFDPICERCARENIRLKLNELLRLIEGSESFREAWGDKSAPLRYRSRDGRIIDQMGAIN